MSRTQDIRIFERRGGTEHWYFLSFRVDLLVHLGLRHEDWLRPDPTRTPLPLVGDEGPSYSGVE